MRRHIGFRPQRTDTKHIGGEYIGGFDVDQPTPVAANMP